MTKKKSTEKALEEALEPIIAEAVEEAIQETVTELTGKAVDAIPIDEYALRVFHNQSPDLNHKVRVERVKTALKNQGYDLRKLKAGVFDDQ